MGLNYPSLKGGDSCFTDKRLEHEFLGLTPSPRASHPVVPTVGRFLFRQIQCITIFFKRQYFLFSPKGVALHPLPEERGFTATFDKKEQMFLSRCHDEVPFDRCSLFLSNRFYMERAAVLSGNELIVQGGLEEGVSLYTGYPGSPLADYFSILYKKKEYLKKRGIRVAMANSEANAAAMASGAKQAGRDCLVAMKSMGLHVASDALSVGNFANPGSVDSEGHSSGVVIVVGDDPWSISTSTPADSRYLFKHLHIPFLEPSTPQELKDWVGRALKLSRETSVYQGLLLTTFMAEGGGRVTLREDAPVDLSKKLLDPNLFDLSKNVMVPPNSLKADKEMIQERFPRVFKAYENLHLDQVFGDKHAKIGIISSGLVFETVKQVLEEKGVIKSISLYKLAGSFPLVPKVLLPYLSSLSHLIVVEEKRGFLESELLHLIKDNNLSVNLYGKRFKNKEGFPAYGGISYEIAETKFEEIFSLLKVNFFKRKNSIVFGHSSALEHLPLRLPTFCPGCPHRETLSVLKDLRKKLDKEGIPLLTHGDVGCYSLSFLPPFKEMHNLSAMGQGGALGAGLDIFTDNPSVVLMGDSTFFHSGLTDISNSVQLGHSITYILLDNDNTAMTGHQMTPVSGVSVEGINRPKQEILATVKALGVGKAMEIHPSDRYFYQNLLFDIIKEPGVKVLISKKECALTFHKRLKTREKKNLEAKGVLRKKTFYQINTLACEDCRICIEETGCPGLTQTFDAYGTKVAIDPQICVADSYCTKIKACPSFEKVTVFDYHPFKYKQEFNLNCETKLPLPQQKVTFDSIAEGEDFRVVVTGVGGSGITTLCRVLGEASKDMGGREDLDFKFVDQKGLAQRNGNVTGHLAVYKKGKSYGAVTPKGTASLYLSSDLLDGARHRDFLSKKGLAVLDTQYQPPISLLLDKGEAGEPVCEKEILNELKKGMSNNLLTFPFKKISHKVLGRSVYAPAMILGVIFQEGRVPFDLASIKTAFQRAVAEDEFKNNWNSFFIGRRLSLERDRLVDNILKKDNIPFLDLYLQSIKESFLPWRNSKIILGMYKRGLGKLCRYLDDIPEDHLASYLHDIYIYNRGREAEDFIKNAGMLSFLYEKKEERAVALRTLAKTYFIKDEVFISHIILSAVKKQRDKEFYRDIGRTFQVAPINRPSFDIFGKTLEFDLNPRKWMLHIMRHCRFLRFVLTAWHRREKDMAHKIRHQIMEVVSKSQDREKLLRKLDNIKGFRTVRYERGSFLFSEESSFC